MGRKRLGKVEHVGRHASRWRWPSQIKPQYRFLVAISGILLLAFAALAVAATAFPQSPQASTQPNPPPQDDNQVTPPDVPANASGQLIAAYVVPPGSVWGTGFQAQVLITNTGATAQRWQVTLSYPQTVTGDVASWVDGAPQPSAVVDGRTFTFTSILPIQPGQSALLKVEFSKVPVADFAVETCTINGRTCDGS